MQAAVATAQAPPSPAPDVRATTEAAIAATVEALRPTSTTEAVPLALAATPTRTPTGVPETRPTIPTPTPTKAPATIPSPAPTATSFPAPTLPVSLRDFRNGRWLEQEDPRLASSIKELAWVRDGIDGTESEAIQSMLYIAVTSRSVVSSLLSLGWVRDDISADEAEAIDWINNMSGAEGMSAVVALGWVQDGIDDALEIRTIEKLSYIANDDTGLGLSVVSLDWVRDGIKDLEAKAIDELSHIAHEDTEAASRIIAMPFIETLEPPDISAMASLSRLAASERNIFDRVMSHPALQDGISDDVTPIVATLGGVARTNVGLIDILLDPDRVSLERRTVTLPLAGVVVLAIIRTAPGAARSMDLLEHSVRAAERFMGASLPTNYVCLLYEDAVHGSFAGTNFGTHIAILPKYDIDDGSHEAASAGSTVAHEVAHYYWSGNADWVDEGAPELMASVIDGARTGRPIGVTNTPCAYAHNIADLEGLGVSRGDVEFWCNYSLGERLFADLYGTLGDERFRQGFRALYLASAVEDEADNYPGTSVGIEHVRRAFRSDDGAERAVIARWYDGTVPYDLSQFDDSPVDPSLPSINGRIDEAYIVTETDGPPVSTFSAQDVGDWVYLTLKHSHNVSGSTREVTLEIVEYFEDGFAFSRRTRNLTAEPRYIGGTRWISVGSPPSRKWAPGRYFVYVYVEGRKVAEVAYEVLP